MQNFSAGMLVGALTTGRLQHAEDALEQKGGLFVDDDVLEMAGKMEDVANCCYHCFQAFSADLLTLIRRAGDEDEDPIEAIETWLDACLEGVHII